MKKFLVILVTIALGAMLVASCSTPLSERFQKFVTYVDTNSGNFTQKDWEKANLYFKGLLTEYAANYQKVSQEERQVINQSISSYHNLAKKSGISSVISNAENSITTFVTNVSEVVKNVGTLMDELGLRP